MERQLNRSELSFTEYANITEDQHICIGGYWGRATHVSHEDGKTFFMWVPDQPMPGNKLCKPVDCRPASEDSVMIHPEDNPLAPEKRFPRGSGSAIACILGGFLWAAVIYFLKYHINPFQP